MHLLKLCLSDNRIVGPNSCFKRRCVKYAAHAAVAILHCYYVLHISNHMLIQSSMCPFASSAISYIIRVTVQAYFLILYMLINSVNYDKKWNPAKIYWQVRSRLCYCSGILYLRNNFCTSFGPKVPWQTTTGLNRLLRLAATLTTHSTTEATLTYTPG